MIKDQIEIVQSRIQAALSRAGRTDPVILIAVTKNHPVSSMRDAINNGIIHVGENKVQEALRKQEEFPDNGATWHLIGHLQTNKAKMAVSHFDLIHSIDSVHVLQAVQHAAAQIQKVQDVLLQVNIAREESKFGMTVEDFPEICKLASTLPNVCVRGLMCIAPAMENAEEVRPIFRIAHALYENMKHTFMEGQIQYLSMGMTHDFEIAIEEGANMVRIGTAIFGSRNY